MLAAPQRRRHRPGADVPTINLVFLLLVFFLMTATLAAPDPSGVQPPKGKAAPSTGGAVLAVGADGTPVFGGLRGNAALSAIAARGSERLLVRADARLPGDALAALLPRLRAAGATRIDLVLAPR